MRSTPRCWPRSTASAPSTITCTATRWTRRALARWKDDNPLGKPRYPEVVGLQRDQSRMAHGLVCAVWLSIRRRRAAASEGACWPPSATRMARAGANWPSIVLDTAGVDIALLNTVAPGAGPDSMAAFAGCRMQIRCCGRSRRDELAGLLGRRTVHRHAAQGCGLQPSAAHARPSIASTSSTPRWRAGRRAARWRSSSCAPTRAPGLRAGRRSGRRAGLPEGRSRAPAGLAPAEQKLLEDYLFGAIAAAAGAQQLVVHIHTGNGDGPFFNNRACQSRACSKTPSIRAPLRKTNFVLLHGGWPYYQVAQAMTDKPNT